MSFVTKNTTPLVVDTDGFYAVKLAEIISKRGEPLPLVTEAILGLANHQGVFGEFGEPHNDFTRTSIGLHQIDETKVCVIIKDVSILTISGGDGVDTITTIGGKVKPVGHYGQFLPFNEKGTIEFKMRADVCRHLNKEFEVKSIFAFDVVG